jgi:hypothetical protein
MSSCEKNPTIPTRINTIPMRVEIVFAIVLSFSVERVIGFPVDPGISKIMLTTRSSRCEERLKSSIIGQLLLLLNLLYLYPLPLDVEAESPV